jgi:nucleoside-diphosphate-sugar epimerase
MSLVLLTGATGFVGRQILESLSRDGIKTRIVLRGRAPGWLSNMQGIEATMIFFLKPHYGGRKILPVLTR